MVYRVHSQCDQTIAALRPSSWPGSSRWVYSAVVAWLLIVSLGICWLTNFSLKTKDLPNAQTYSWPPDSTIAIESRPNLIIFLHPKCSCSLATVNELKKILARLNTENIRKLAIFYCPENESSEWIQTALWEQTRRISDLDVVVDRGGRESRKFGVNTSGHVKLFDRRGKSSFDGGITSSRGCAGDNLGASALSQLIAGRGKSTHGIPVFGCLFRNEGGTIE